MLRKTFLVICLILCSVFTSSFTPAFGEQQHIDFANVTNDNTLTTILRERLSRTGDTFTFNNGLTIDNVTNNAMEWFENSEALIWTFSSDTITLSSDTSVATFDFGTVDPTCDQLTLENAAVISNETDGDVVITEGGEILKLRFSTDNVEFLTGSGILGLDVNDLYIIYHEISAPSNDPANGYGWLYVKDNSGTTDLYFEDDAGGVTELTASASGVANLDEAYDGGGSGAGKAVTVDQGAIALTATDAANNTVLSLVQQDQAAASTLVITGSQATANAISIDIDAQTTGRDIEGTGASFYVEGDGTVVAVDVDITGSGGLTLENDETILNAAETEITFTDSASSEDIIIDLDAGANAVGWKSGSGVDEWAFGDVDDLTGISTMVFDATSVSITHTPDGAGEDFTIQQNGTTQNTSLIITTAGTPADALQLTASAGGIDISATSSDAGDDIDITATGTSVNITATENAADSIVISSSNAGIQILAPGAAAGEDILVTATGSSIIATSTENQANAITLNASDAAGGIDVDAGTGGIAVDITGAADFRVDSSAGSIVLVGAEAAIDAITIDAENAAGGIDVDAGTGGITVDITGAADFRLDSSAGSIVLIGAEAAADAITIDAENAAGGIDVDAGTGGITVDITGAADFRLDSSAGSIVLVGAEAAADAITIDAETDAGGGIDIDFGTGNLVITGNTAGADMTIDCDLFSIDGTGTSNITVTGGANEDFSILQAGGNVDNSLILTSTGNAEDALQIATLTNGGGINITADGTGAGAKNLDLVCTNGSTNLSGGEADADAVHISAASGGITILSGIDAASSIELQANAGTSETIKIYANQGTGNASIDLLSDDGGMTLTANAGNALGQIIISSALVMDGATTAFGAADATPDVSGHTLFITGGNDTYTNFDCGTGTCDIGQIVIVFSAHTATFDTTATNLSGSSADLVTASGDITMWIFDGTNWRCLQFTDVSADNSGGV